MPNSHVRRSVPLASPLPMQSYGFTLRCGNFWLDSELMIVLFRGKSVHAPFRFKIGLRSPNEEIIGDDSDEENAALIVVGWERTRN